jgi:hypothetical protein
VIACDKVPLGSTVAANCRGIVSTVQATLDPKVQPDASANSEHPIESPSIRRDRPLVPARGCFVYDQPKVDAMEELKTSFDRLEETFDRGFERQEAQAKRTLRRVDRQDRRDDLGSD